MDQSLTANLLPDDTELNLRVETLYIRNYRSIENATIEFNPLTLLVGRNGVGKSNVLDALSFLADSLRDGVDTAIRKRGGISKVRRRSNKGRSYHVTLAIRVRIASGVAAYRIQIGDVAGGGYEIAREECRVSDHSGREIASFRVRKDSVVEWTLESSRPAIVPKRLYLIAASGYPEFNETFDAITRMTFHNLNPEAMKGPQNPDAGERLSHDGDNLASVVNRLRDHAPDRLDDITETLRSLGIPIYKIKHKGSGALETVVVTQRFAPESDGYDFDAMSISDGTLRALGILLSLTSAFSGESGPTLIGIEEPETALHPAAVGALFSEIVRYSQQTQVVLTCHSPDFLDDQLVTAEMVRVVLLEPEGVSVVAPLSDEKKALLQDHLITAGEMLRVDQMTPSPVALTRSKTDRSQMNISDWLHGD